MPLDARGALVRLTAGESLTREETEELFGQLMDGLVSETLKAALLVALRMKGEAVSEISGAAEIGMCRARRLRLSARCSLCSGLNSAHWRSSGSNRNMFWMASSGIRQE